MRLLEQMIYYRDDELTSILCYPRYAHQEFKKRLDYINTHGIRLLKHGKTLINNHNVLGKGHAGVVIKGILNGQEVAVKIRRMDSKRRDLNHEANMLRLANNVGVGPKLFYVNRDIIVMEYIDGINIEEFDNIKYIIKDILEQCFRLDLINLDHGELSRMNKHVIIGDEIKIIDFDSASVSRRASNVTSVTQYFINTDNNKSDIFARLRKYKRCICHECFNELLISLKVK
jgi:putative serine/threonine protein kinase